MCIHKEACVCTLTTTLASQSAAERRVSIWTGKALLQLKLKWRVWGTSGWDCKGKRRKQQGIPENSNPTQPSVLKAACLTIRRYFICSSGYKSGTRYRSILNHPKLQQRHFLSLFWNGVTRIYPVALNSRRWKVMCLSDTPSLTPHLTQRQTFEPITAMEIVHLVLEIWIVGIFSF